MITSCRGGVYLDSSITKSIDALKSRLDSENILVVQRDEGFIYNVKFEFNNPASIKDIDRFVEKKDGVFLMTIKNSCLNIMEHYSFQMLNMAEDLNYLVLMKFIKNILSSSTISLKIGFPYLWIMETILLSTPLK